MLLVDTFDNYLLSVRLDDDTYHRSRQGRARLQLQFCLASRSMSVASTKSLDMLANDFQYIVFIGESSGNPYAQARLRAEFGPEGIGFRVSDEDSYVT